MARVRVSAEARRDLQRIGEAGVRDHGAAASARHVEGFQRLFQLRREQPFAGQEWPELELGVRSLSHRPHRILYRTDGETVIVTRIIHLARNLGGALRDEH